MLNRQRVQLGWGQSVIQTLVQKGKHHWLSGLLSGVCVQDHMEVQCSQSASFPVHFLPQAIEDFVPPLVSYTGDIVVRFMACL